MHISLQRIAQWGIALVLMVFIIMSWKFNLLGQNIINLLGCSLFVVGLDNLVIWYGCYWDELSMELLGNFSIMLIFVLGELFETFNSSPEVTLPINIFCYYLIVVYLSVNMACLMGSCMIIGGYFVRYLYRLTTNRLLSPEEALDEERL